jgi:S1-C subfamily serine protease
MNIFREVTRRVALLVVLGLVVLGVGAGLALARSKPAPIGSGVVVVETNLAFQNAAAAGTGMVLTPSGEVLTNNHVIRGATTVKVVVPGTRRSYSATVVGYSITADVAVLQLRGASNLKTVSIGNSAKLTVGQAVRALGNAGGTGRLTPATGTITGLHRSITASDESGSSEDLVGLIETNAGIAAGDSGGPLFDRAGRVIGMDTAASTGPGFQMAAVTDAYAIPIGKALTVAREIVAGKTSPTVHVGATAFLGIEVQSVDASSGALIAGVVPGGPADSAGLVAGDVITAVGSSAVSSPSAVSALLQTQKPGTAVSISYVAEDGTSQTATVTLGSGPPQ